MPVKGSPERNGRTLIEQDPHTASRRNSKTLTRVLEDGIDLVAGNPRKPRQEIRDRCAAFEILEERAHRNAERSRHRWRFSKVSIRFARA